MSKPKVTEADTSITLQPGVSRDDYVKTVEDRTVHDSKSEDKRGAK